MSAFPAPPAEAIEARARALGVGAASLVRLDVRTHGGANSLTVAGAERPIEIDGGPGVEAFAAWRLDMLKLLDPLPLLRCRLIMAPHLPDPGPTPAPEALSRATRRLVRVLAGRFLEGREAAARPPTEARVYARPAIDGAAGSVVAAEAHLGLLPDGPRADGFAPVEEWLRALAGWRRGVAMISLSVGVETGSAQGRLGLLRLAAEAEEGP